MNLLTSSKKRLVSLKNWFVRLSIIKKLLLIGVILLVGWFGSTKVLGTKTQQAQYQTSQVERGSLITTVTASGNIASGNSVSIATTATGVVSAIYVKNGDTVAQGQKIAEIKLDQSAQQKQSAAWASYLGAQNSLNSAKSKMNSLQSSLFKANQAFVKDAGTPNPDTADPKYIEERADWLQAESDYNNQAGVISQAEASLSSAWLSYQQTSSVVLSPVAGTISNLTISEGYPLSSNSSDSSTTNSSTSSSQSLGAVSLDNSQLQASVNLSEIDVTKVKVGQKVTMTLDAFADKTFTGKISAIDTNGSVSSGVTTYPATITFDSSVSGIYPNMGVSATIITSVKDDVLLVPTSAVQTSSGESVVRVMKNGQVQQVTVQVGDSSDTQTEIVSGVNEGDEVVTSTVSSTTTTGRTGAAASPFGGAGFGGGNVRVFNGAAGGNNRGR